MIPVDGDHRIFVETGLFKGIQQNSYGIVGISRAVQIVAKPCPFMF